MRIGSLFSGIGGLELGLEWAGVGHTVWQVEREPSCQEVLAKHWPDVKRYDDVCTAGAHNLEPVDVICGGFPCQDISYAGKGAGLAGARSGLWYEFARISGELGPRYVVVENVAALLRRGMGEVLGTLSDLGYDAEWEVLSACAFGAPHTRERVFVLAYAKGARFLQCGRIEQSKNSTSERNVHHWANQSEPLRVADGIPNRMDRLRALGNSVVPQIAEMIGAWILLREEVSV